MPVIFCGINFQACIFLGLQYEAPLDPPGSGDVDENTLTDLNDMW